MLNMLLQSSIYGLARLRFLPSLASMAGVLIWVAIVGDGRKRRSRERGPTEPLVCPDCFETFISADAVSTTAVGKGSQFKAA